LLGTLATLSTKPSYFKAQNSSLSSVQFNKQQPTVSMFEVILPASSNTCMPKDSNPC